LLNDEQVVGLYRMYTFQKDPMKVFYREETEKNCDACESVYDTLK
jgi:hypothetical protein